VGKSAVALPSNTRADLEGGVAAESLPRSAPLSGTAALGVDVGCATDGFGLDSDELGPITAIFDFGTAFGTAALEVGDGV